MNRNSEENYTFSQGNKCTLVIYMSIIVVLLGLMIAAIVVDVESRDLTFLRDAMNYSLSNYDPGLSEEWDEIQRNVREADGRRRFAFFKWGWFLQNHNLESI